jgi:hypothetical protein
VFEIAPTAPETGFATVSTAPETVFETGSVAPETLLVTVSTGLGAVVETVFVTVSTGSDVVLVTVVTTGAAAVVTGVGSIGTSSANACNGAHPRDTTTTAAHMIEKRCALIDPFVTVPPPTSTVASRGRIPPVTGS